MPLSDGVGCISRICAIDETGQLRLIQRTTRICKRENTPYSTPISGTTAGGMAFAETEMRLNKAGIKSDQCKPTTLPLIVVQYVDAPTNHGNARMAISLPQGALSPP